MRGSFKLLNKQLGGDVFNQLTRDKSSSVYYALIHLKNEQKINLTLIKDD